VSLYDYKKSQQLGDVPFYALIMACMRRADTMNLAKLKQAWPLVWQELEQRYHAPGGYLPNEQRPDQAV